MPAIRLYARAQGSYEVADEIYITAGKQLGITIIVAVIFIFIIIFFVLIFIFVIVFVLVVFVIIVFELSLRKDYYAG